MLKEYVADLCAASIAKELLHKRCAFLCRVLNDAISAKQPVISEQPGFFWAAILVIPMIILVIVALALIAGVIWFFGYNWLLGILVGIAGGFFALLILGGAVSLFEIVEGQWEEYSEKVEKHKRSVENFESDMERWREEKSQIPKLEEEIAIIRREIDQVSQECDRLLDMNRIPTQYRYLTALLFIYDWFKSSGTEDMNMAISQYDRDHYTMHIKDLDNNKYQLLSQLLARESTTIQLLRQMKYLW